MARQMKNSGIEWIGEIPIDWSVCHFRNILDVYNGNSIKDEEKINYEDPTDAIPYIATKDIDATFQTIDYDNGMYVKEFDDSFKRAPKNSILLCIEGGSAGKKIAFTNQEVCFINKLCCFNSKIAYNRYVYYYMLSPAFTEEFKSHISGLIGGVSISEIKGFAITFPPYNNQKRIAEFLDRKCNEIDAVIKKTKATIEEYKKLKQSVITEAVTKGIRGDRPMKDSGIEWIGEIPREWIVRKGKWILSIFDKPIREDDGVITCFRDGEVTLRSNRREDGFTFAIQEIGYQGVDVGDLVVHGMDGFAGAIGISDSRGKASPVLNVMDSTENKRYIMYYLRNMAYNGIFISLATGIRVRSCDTNWNKLKELPYIIPSSEEQEEIVTYIDKRCYEIDTLIAKKTALLEEMESYKKSVIYEYVTGKKECQHTKEAESVSVIYPYFPAVFNTDKVRFAQAVLMSKILDSNVSYMGRVKLGKMLFTIEHCLGFDFNTEYRREAAGPLDSSIYECEKVISRANKWFYVNSSKHGTSYKPQKDMVKYKKYYEQYFSEHNEEIERIISIFKNYSLDQSEIVATLYGVWNDFIIDKRPFTDDDIVTEVLTNWNESKKRFSKDVWLRAIKNMRQNNLVPNGYGKHTIIKEVEV